MRCRPKARCRRKAPCRRKVLRMACRLEARCRLEAHCASGAVAKHASSEGAAHSVLRHVAAWRRAARSCLVSSQDTYSLKSRRILCRRMARRSLMAPRRLTALRVWNRLEAHCRLKAPCRREGLCMLCRPRARCALCFSESTRRLTALRVLCSSMAPNFLRRPRWCLKLRPVTSRRLRRRTV